MGEFGLYFQILDSISLNTDSKWASLDSKWFLNADPDNFRVNLCTRYLLFLMLLL